MKVKWIIAHGKTEDDHIYAYGEVVGYVTVEDRVHAVILRDGDHLDNRPITILTVIKEVTEPKE